MERPQVLARYRVARVAAAAEHGAGLEEVERELHHGRARRELPRLERRRIRPTDHAEGARRDVARDLHGLSVGEPRCIHAFYELDSGRGAGVVELS